MCLTGVDYFSTLGYAPGIAFLAAGALSPLATLILVFLTLAGALPVYMKVAEESPHGQGSISMLAKLLQGWKGKILILCLLGFAATDFIITITLSAADAAAHIAQNPWALPWMHDRISMTMILLALLGGVFLIGFREAISISVVLVGLYLALNAVVVAVSSTHLMQEPVKINDWMATLTRQYESPWRMIGISVLLFPKLALGMSGFETGVAVSPLVKGKDGDNAESTAGQNRQHQETFDHGSGDHVSIFDYHIVDYNNAHTSAALRKWWHGKTAEPSLIWLTCIWETLSAPSTISAQFSSYGSPEHQL